MFYGLGEVPKLPDSVDEALRHRSWTEKTGHFLKQAFGEDRDLLADRFDFRTIGRGLLAGGFAGSPPRRGGRLAVSVCNS